MSGAAAPVLAISRLSYEPIETIIHGRYHYRDRTPRFSDLTTSIRHDGLLTPLLVVEKEGYLQLVDGHQRLAVAASLNLSALPCQTIAASTADLECLKYSLILNNYHSVLNHCEKARAFALAQSLGQPADCIVHELLPAAGVQASASLLDDHLALLSGSLRLIKIAIEKKAPLRLCRQLALLDPVSGDRLADLATTSSLSIQDLVLTTRYLIEISIRDNSSPALVLERFGGEGQPGLLKRLEAGRFPSLIERNQHLTAATGALKQQGLRIEWDPLAAQEGLSLSCKIESLDDLTQVATRLTDPMVRDLFRSALDWT